MYHNEDNPVVKVGHGTDFASSVTGPVTVGRENSTVTLEALQRKCARISFKTERQAASSDITRIRVRSLTLEEMSDQPAWATGVSDLETADINTYSATIRMKDTDFTVPAGNADYQQTGAAYCLPLPERDFRIRVEALFNEETRPYVLEATVEKTAFKKGSDNRLTLYLGRKKVKVVVSSSWTVIDKQDDVFGKID